jgi:hypothetical protein
MVEAMLEPLVTLWIGERLGAVERACLRSWLDQGHDVGLYCYDEPVGVPEGVTLRDAAAIVPAARIVRHKSGSVALFSNLFRYELQRRGLGIWLDTDQYLVAPVRPASPHLFAWESYRWLGIGVLRIPPDSPMLTELIAVFDEEREPFWLPPHERIAASVRLLRTGRTGIGQMRWGSAGPQAVTALARKHGMIGEALPRSACYPVAATDADWIRDPLRGLGWAMRDGGFGVHLWNQLIQSYKDAPAPAGSFLERLQREGA